MNKKEGECELYTRKNKRRVTKKDSSSSSLFPSYNPLSTRAKEVTTDLSNTASNNNLFDFFSPNEEVVSEKKMRKKRSQGLNADNILTTKRARESRKMKHGVAVNKGGAGAPRAL